MFPVYWRCFLLHLFALYVKVNGQIFNIFQQKLRVVILFQLRKLIQKMSCICIVYNGHYTQRMYYLSVTLT